MEQSLKAEVLILIPNVRLYEIRENSKKSLTSGELKVLRLPIQKIFILLVSDYSYSLSKELQTMRSSSNQYVFPNLNSFLGVLIPNDTDPELLETFEIILRDTTDFLVSQQRHNQSELARSTTFNLEAAERIQEYSKTRKLSLLIESGGEHIKKGLMRAATFTSAGIRRGSELLKSKIKSKKSMNDSLSSDEEEQNEEKKEKMKKTVQGLKFVSSAVLMLSKAVVVGAVGTTKEIGKWVSERFEESETSKKWERTESYQSAKLIGKAGLSAAVSIYDGLEEALVILSREGANAAVEVVDKRYGGDAKKNAEEVVDVLGNVGLIVREVGKIGVKTVAKAASELNNEKKK